MPKVGGSLDATHHDRIAVFARSRVVMSPTGGGVGSGGGGAASMAARTSGSWRSGIGYAVASRISIANAAGRFPKQGGASNTETGSLSEGSFNV